jgi:hypothetical protein
MKDPDRKGPKRPKHAVPKIGPIIGARRILVAGVEAGFPLITQRSSVQIRPPQP